MSSPRFAPAWLFCLVLASGCGEPPHREINQAQGAIDTARAAGAAAYAPEEFKAAESALERSRDAVEERDYRLALNYAIDARERAQEAARTAADQKSRVRSRVDETLRKAEASFELAKSQLAEAQEARVPARQLSPALESIAATGAQLIEVRALIQRDELLQAQAQLDDLLRSLETARSEIDAATAARPAPRPPRRGTTRPRR
jgi:hypothetical protein